MARDMATFRKRGPYQWEARIRKRGYPTTCKTFDTKVEAEAWAKDVETNLNKSLFVSAKEAEQYTQSECYPAPGLMSGCVNRVFVADFESAGLRLILARYGKSCFRSHIQ